MKEGDKAWVYSDLTQEIKECTLLVYHEGTEWTVFYNDDPWKQRSCGWKEGVDLFHTREELCEHYRKIFEL